MDRNRRLEFALVTVLALSPIFHPVPVRAKADPSVTLGGSYAEHDADLPYGRGCAASVPVRVRHASGGARVRYPLGAPNGDGTVLDARGGVVVSRVERASFSEASLSAEQADAVREVSGDEHVLPAGQLMFGPRKGPASLSGGLAFQSVLGIDEGRSTTTVLVVPTLELDARGAEGLRLNVGFGIPPETGLAPRHSAYWRFGYVFRDGPDFGLGVTALFLGGIDTQAAMTLTAAVPVVPSLSLGAFGMLGPAVGVEDPVTHEKPLGWRAGGHVTFHFVGADETRRAASPPR